MQFAVFRAPFELRVFFVHAPRYPLNYLSLNGDRIIYRFDFSWSCWCQDLLELIFLPPPLLLLLLRSPRLLTSHGECFTRGEPRRGRKLPRPFSFNSRTFINASTAARECGLLLLLFLLLFLLLEGVSKRKRFLPIAAQKLDTTRLVCLPGR